MNETVVELSRLQFALTAYYHFLFVPLTIGLAILLGVMETVYVMTNRQDGYPDFTKHAGRSLDFCDCDLVMAAVALFS